MGNMWIFFSMESSIRLPRATLSIWLFWVSTVMSSNTPTNCYSSLRQLAHLTFTSATSTFPTTIVLLSAWWNFALMLLHIKLQGRSVESYGSSFPSNFKKRQLLTALWAFLPCRRQQFPVLLSSKEGWLKYRCRASWSALQTFLFVWGLKVWRILGRQESLILSWLHSIIQFWMS